MLSLAFSFNNYEFKYEHLGQVLNAKISNENYVAIVKCFEENTCFPIHTQGKWAYPQPYSVSHNQEKWQGTQS